MENSQDRLVNALRNMRIQRDLLLELSNTRDLSETLEMCIDAAIKISEMDSGGIYLFDETGGIVLVKSKGLSDEFVKEVNYFPPDSINTTAVKAGKPTYILYTKDTPDFIARIKHNEGLKFIAGVPILCKGKITGSLIVSSRKYDSVPEVSRNLLETITSIIGILINRARYEENLIKAQKRFTQAEKMAKIGHWERSFSDHTSSWSMGTYDIFGVNPKSFKPTEDNFNKAIHPDDLQSLKKSINESLLSGKHLNVVYRIIRPDGEIVTVQSHAETIIDSEGHNLLIGTIQDITIQKAIERDLEVNTFKLQEMNTAMKVLIDHREKEILTLKSEIMENITKMVLPYLEKLEKGISGTENRIYLEMARSNLKKLTQPFAKKLTEENLTSSELEVAILIKNGKITKEIASLLNISENTVMTHRFKIRKKLGLIKEKTNLHSFLQSMM